MELKTLYHVFREIAEVNRKLHDIESFSDDDNSIFIYMDEIHKLNWLCSQLEPLCDGVEPVNLRWDAGGRTWDEDLGVWRKGDFTWDEHLDIFEKQEEQ
tara:strand:- start:1258 stop:1554 length:297 start_codon:yes stop_codon:yes gene_type:complete